MIKSELEAISFIKRQKRNGVTTRYLSKEYNIPYFQLVNLISGRTKKFRLWRNIEGSIINVKVLFVAWCAMVSRPCVSD